MLCTRLSGVSLIQNAVHTCNVYTADREDHVAEHGDSFHAFAVDTQLYVHCRRRSTTQELHRGSQPLDVCQPSRDERAWTKRSCSGPGHVMVRLCWGALVCPCSLGLKPSDQVRVLGVTLTSDMCLDKHVASVCATCFYWLRQLRPVRRSLDAESAATLVRASVTSHVDYCNAILAGASKSTTDKLQRVLNAAARGSTTTDSAISCTTSCTVWTFLSGCSTSCAQRSIDVCSTKHHST